MYSNVFVFRQFAIFLTISVFCRMKSTAMYPGSSSRTGRYEPLYLVANSEKVSIANLMIFDVQYQKHVLVCPKDYRIVIACPIENGLTLEVLDKTVRKIRTPWEPRCDNPVKSWITSYSNSDFSVGFVVYEQDSHYSQLELDAKLPPDHHFFPFMIFRFKKEKLHTVRIWHNIDFGEWIQIESEESTNNKEYEKNQDIFGLDVDEVYEWEHQRWIFIMEFEYDLLHQLVKIQLVPAEDLLLENYKTASRINLNTVSIWETLLPQWRSLETFVRKVARVLGRLRIATGTFKTLQWPHPTKVLKDVKLHYSGKFALPRYIWKAVITRNGEISGGGLNYGILFIMYNNYTSTSPDNEPPLCHDIILGTGWDLHTWQQSGVERTSRIYACALTQDTMNLLKGGKLLVPQYEVFNLHRVLKSHYDEEFSFEEFKEINVIEELRAKNLLA